jgi:hypothetical protein
MILEGQNYRSFSISALYEALESVGKLALRIFLRVME